MNNRPVHFEIQVDEPERAWRTDDAQVCSGWNGLARIFS